MASKTVVRCGGRGSGSSAPSGVRGGATPANDASTRDLEPGEGLGHLRRHGVEPLWGDIVRVFVGEEGAVLDSLELVQNGSQCGGRRLELEELDEEPA